MKTTLEYLEELREMEYHNLGAYSANYAMTIPEQGFKEQFEEAQRDVEIIQQLIEKEKSEFALKEEARCSHKQQIKPKVSRYSGGHGHDVLIDGKCIEHVKSVCIKMTDTIPMAVLEVYLEPYSIHVDLDTNVCENPVESNIPIKEFLEMFKYDTSPEAIKKAMDYIKSKKDA